MKATPTRRKRNRDAMLKAQCRRLERSIDTAITLREQEEVFHYPFFHEWPIGFQIESPVIMPTPTI